MFIAGGFGSTFALMVGICAVVDGMVHAELELIGEAVAVAANQWHTAMWLSFDFRQPRKYIDMVSLGWLALDDRELVWADLGLCRGSSW